MKRDLCVDNERPQSLGQSLGKWPIIGNDDIASVLHVLENGPLTKGPVSRELEKAFSDYIHVNFCRAVSSCTHAIHLALRAIGVGPGNEVLVPDLTYCGSVSPIVNCGATPVFVDINETDYNFCLNDAASKRTKRTRAVIPVHLHGYPCDISALRSALPGLPVVEDACQAHGAQRAGHYAGSWGEVACFSLNQVKPLCGGQGGLIVTNDQKMWEVICDLASPGQHSTIGLSYEITELSAALALSQLRKLDTFLKKAQDNYFAFINALRGDLRICVQPCEEDVYPTWHKIRIRLSLDDRNRLLSVFDQAQIPYETWPGTLVSERTEYSKYTAHTPIARAVMASSFVLGNERYPFHAQSNSTIVKWAQLINRSILKEEAHE